MRLLSASILKLWRRPATRRTFLVLVGFLALIYLSIGGSVSQIQDPIQREAILEILAFPAAYTNLATFLVSFGAIAAAALAGLLAGGEWTWGTFRTAVARGESRVRYVVATYGALAVLVVIAVPLLYVVGIVLIIIGDVLAGINPGDLADPDGLGRVPALVVAAAIAIVTSAALGFAIAFVLRNQIAGLVGVIGLNFGEQILGGVIPRDIMRFAPTTSGTSLIAEAGANGFSADWLVYGVVVLAYAVAAIVVASVFALRTEVP